MNHRILSLNSNSIQTKAIIIKQILSFLKFKTGQ